ncbi:MAG: GvpL/GvpF family gas vesicle protein [Candidatus Dormibacteraeota bacterium]|nr:GvpL/GvpF family gas vesicle protein [Candidatus Dormibacteraeota bacterium]
MSVDEQPAEGRWIYGVVPAGAQLRQLRGGGGQIPEVWVVESGELGAIVGSVPRNDAKATRDQALAHSRVLEAAVADAPVVPFRFGMIVPGGDEEVSRDLLDAYHDQLAPLLEKLRGVVQMTVKVDYREDVLLRDILEGEPEIARLREATRQGPEDAMRNERIRLGELISAAVETRRQRDAAEVVQALEPAAAAAAVDQLEQEYMVLNGAFLVDRERTQEFADAVDRVAQEHISRMQFRLLGPMPAYSFIDLQQQQAARA